MDATTKEFSDAWNESPGAAPASAAPAAPAASAPAAQPPVDGEQGKPAAESSSAPAGGGGDPLASDPPKREDGAAAAAGPDITPAQEYAKAWADEPTPAPGSPVMEAVKAAGAVAA